MKRYSLDRRQTLAADLESRASRRDFMRRTLLAGAGLCLPSLLDLQVADADPLGLVMPTAAQQKQVGQQGAAEVRQKYREVTDSRARHFRAIGERLIRALPAKEQQTWDFSFRVLASKEVNAFALPGGPMFMFTGLYELMQSDDAVAGVTGHELTHVREQHWAKAYADENRRKTLATGALILTHAPLSAAVAVALAHRALNLRYSRGEEDQADAGGIQDMVDAGYNPYGMVQMFTTLQRVQDAHGGSPPVILSDHPDTAARIRHSKQRIAAYGSNRKWPPFTPLNYAHLVG
jgi:beta-barrel assembly-enhancing protease